MRSCFLFVKVQLWPSTYDTSCVIQHLTGFRPMVKMSVAYHDVHFHHDDLSVHLQDQEWGCNTLLHLPGSERSQITAVTPSVLQSHMMPALYKEESVLVIMLMAA